MSTHYHLWINGRDAGPFSADEVATMRRGGAIDDEVPLRASGASEWHRVGDVSFEAVAPRRSNPRAIVALVVAGLFAAAAFVFIGLGLLVNYRAESSLVERQKLREAVVNSVPKPTPEIYGPAHYDADGEPLPAAGGSRE